MLCVFNRKIGEMEQVSRGYQKSNFPMYQCVLKIFEFYVKKNQISFAKFSINPTFAHSKPENTPE